MSRTLARSAPYNTSRSPTLHCRQADLKIKRILKNCKWLQKVKKRRPGGHDPRFVFIDRQTQPEHNLQLNLSAQTHFGEAYNL
jgi:hypothetical protein